MYQGEPLSSMAPMSGVVRVEITPFSFTIRRSTGSIPGTGNVNPSSGSAATPTPFTASSVVPSSWKVAPDATVTS